LDFIAILTFAFVIMILIKIIIKQRAIIILAFWLLATFIVGIKSILAYNNVHFINFDLIKTLGALFNPRPHFLSDIAGILAVILSISTPLSIDLIIRLSDRYGSDTISEYIQKRFIMGLIPALAIINIFIAIILRFFVNDETSNFIWKLSAFILLISFIFTIIMFYRFLFLQIKLLRSTKTILKELDDEAKAFFE